MAVARLLLVAAVAAACQAQVGAAPAPPRPGPQAAVPDSAVAEVSAQDGRASGMEVAARGDTEDGAVATRLRDAGFSDVSVAPGRVSCKRGVAYGHHSPADMQALSRGISWWYNWASRPDNEVGNAWRPLGVDFAPMVWGGRFTDAQVVAAIPQGATYLLGFNEPNFTSQANLTPAQAAALWPRLEAIARQRNLKLVSPAVNYCGGGCNVTNPFEWLDQFFAACAGCKVDYVAAHIYSCYGAALRSYLRQLEKYGRPIWITEFSCASDAPETLANQMRLMRESVDIMETSPTVFRYSWFAARSTAIDNVNLLAASGQLTPLGELYLSLPHGQACSR